MIEGLEQWVIEPEAQTHEQVQHTGGAKERKHGTDKTSPQRLGQFLGTRSLLEQSENWSDEPATPNRLGRVHDNSMSLARGLQSANRRISGATSTRNR